MGRPTHELIGREREAEDRSARLAFRAGILGATGGDRQQLEFHILIGSMRLCLGASNVLTTATMRRRRAHWLANGVPTSTSL